MSSTIVSVTVSGNRVVLTSPYNPALPAQAKRVGGRWDSVQHVWTFDTRDEDRVRELAREVYGTDGTPTRTVTVRATLGQYDLGGETVYVCGRAVLRRARRDDPVRLGDGCVLLSGRFYASGGSVAHPEIGDPAGSDTVVVEIRDVPADLVTESDTLQIVDAAADRRAAIEAEIAATEARLLALRAELAAL